MSATTLRLEDAKRLQAIVVTEAPASKMEGTTAYGRRATLAIENPSMAVERGVSENPNRRIEVTYRLGGHTTTGDH